MNGVKMPINQMNLNHQCPDYYQLADGRAMIDWIDERIPSIIPVKLKEPVYHALVSAMEHRFRNGFKKGFEAHDRQAERFWSERVLQLEPETGSILLDVVRCWVDYERSKKTKATATPLETKEAT